MKQENQTTKNKKTNEEKVDRIPLSTKSSVIITKSIEHMVEAHPGVNITRKGIVNWIIEKCFSKVTPTYEKQLVEEFYDELKFLENSVRALKKKRRLGEDVSDDPILSQIKPLLRKKKPKPKIENNEPPTAEKLQPTKVPGAAPKQEL